MFSEFFVLRCPGPALHIQQSSEPGSAPKEAFEHRPLMTTHVLRRGAGLEVRQYLRRYFMNPLVIAICKTTDG
jgi:hypothetical protein